MHSHHLSRIALLALLALPLGCGSSPEPLPPKVSSGLDSLRNEAVALKGQIEKVKVSLSDLMEKPQADLKPQNWSFTQELAGLEGRLERAQAQRQIADRMVAEQFATWDSQLDQLQSEESKEMAAERRTATAETIDGIQQKIEKLRDTFAPFLTDLRDIRQYLKGDLSPKGLETMKPTAERVFSAEGEIQSLLDGVIAGITSAIG
jgi:Skp family chaperone for outer membrane proteins